ncbi:hypothetical protein PMIN04_012259 [Paraphaeosphaeria minitans]
MAALLNTFPVQQPLQFVSYDGPPKQTPRRLPTKKQARSGHDELAPNFDDILGIEPDSNSARGDGKEPAHTAHGVEVVDLTCFADNEADYEISGSGRESNDVGSQLNRSHSISNSRIDGAFGTLKSPNQDYTAERNITFGIDDHQVHPMAESGEEGECFSRRADLSTQNTTGDLALVLNKSEVIDLADLGDKSSDDDEDERGDKYRSLGSRSSSVLQDARCAARPTSTTSQSLPPSSGNIQVENAVPLGDLLFVMDTGISSSDQSLQKDSSHAIPDLMVESWQPRRSELVSNQGQYSPHRGNRGDDHGHSDDNGHDNRGRRMNSPGPVQKRKRDASVGAVGHKQHSRTSSKRSKQRPTKAAHAPKQRPRYLSRYPPQPTPKVRPRACAEVQCGGDIGAESSSNSAGNDENNYHVNSVQSTDKLVLNWGSASDDTEYEVERILAVCLRRGNLMYQVQWVGYEADPEWYSAPTLKIAHSNSASSTRRTLPYQVLQNGLVTGSSVAKKTGMQRIIQTMISPKGLRVEGGLSSRVDQISE